MTNLEAPNLAGIEESATLGMTRRAAELSTPDDPVLTLSAGEPDFPTPDFIAAAGVRAIEEGRTNYPPAAGLAPLRAAIADEINASTGSDYDRENVIVSVGAKQAIFDAVFTLFGPGDRVAVPTPYWVSYPPIVQLARAEPVPVPTTADEGFKPSPAALEQAFAEGASGVILNSPNNPSGAVIGSERLSEIVSVAERHGAWIISDEIYAAIDFEGRFASIGRHAREYERIVLVNGFSKAFAMTGWRVGYALAPSGTIDLMSRLQGHVNTNTSLPSQYAALAALEERGARDDAIDRMVQAFRRRRDLLVAGLSEVEGIEVFVPEGAFYLWFDIGSWCDSIGTNSEGVCMDLIENERLALVPGSAFGVDRYARLSFAASDEALVEAVDRLRVASRRIGRS